MQPRRPHANTPLLPGGELPVIQLPASFDRGLAAIIDHTLLRPEATAAEVQKLCAEARAFGFCSVCVNSTWVSTCRELLLGSKVKVCCVVGFPLGASDTRTKASEARTAVEDGAEEIDMVIALGPLKSGDHAYVLDDLRAVVRAAAGRTVKVILETGALTEAEKVAACRLAAKARATFVKTSTGFGKGGATVADITLMRATVGPTLGVKASGGIKTLADAQALVKAGATRLGTSSGVAIVTGGEGTGY